MSNVLTGNVSHSVSVTNPSISNVRAILTDGVSCGKKSTFIYPEIIDNPYEPFKSYIYNLCGIDPNDVVVECRWRNLFEYYDIIVTIKNSDLNIYNIPVDPRQYDAGEWWVENGQLKIKLHEIIKEQPMFKLIEGGTN